MPNPSPLLKRLFNRLRGRRTIESLVEVVGSDKWRELWALADPHTQARMIQAAARRIDLVRKQKLGIAKAAPRTQPWSKERWAELGRLIKAGAEATELAERLDITPDAARARQSEWLKGKRETLSPGRPGRKFQPEGLQRWERLGKLVEANKDRRPKEIDQIVAAEFGITVRDAAKRRSKWKRGVIDKHMREGAPA